MSVPAKWMVPHGYGIAHYFLLVDLNAGFADVNSASGCDRFPLAKLEENEDAPRCVRCVRDMLRSRFDDLPTHL